jgi:hypothetical protein
MAGQANVCRLPAGKDPMTVNDFGGPGAKFPLFTLTNRDPAANNHYSGPFYSRLALDVFLLPIYYCFLLILSCTCVCYIGL